MVGAGSHRIDGLDALRGLTALAIAVFHTVIILDLIPRADLPAFFQRLFIAVPLFFAVSAFSLCIVYFDRLNSPADVRKFFLRRSLRILPLFYLLLAFWIVVRGTTDAWTIGLNVSFLFPFVPGKNESLVGAGWSIGVEMVFYALFPFLISWMRSIWSSVFWLLVSTAVAVFAGVASSAAQLPGYFDWLSAPVQLPFFVAGILVFHVFHRLADWNQQHRRMLSIGLLMGVPIGLFVLSNLGVFVLQFQGWSVGRHLLGAALLPLVLAFALCDLKLVVNRATIFVGTVSYGLYLIHPLLIRSVGRPMKALLVDAGASPLAVAAIITFTIVVGATALAAVTYYGLERPISRYRPRRSEATLAA